MVASLAGAACGRSAESRAAERAQDACIGSLEPVSEGGTPSPDVLERAVADAEDAAEVDERWEPLRARLRAARAGYGTPALEQAVDGLIEECKRVNDIVRSGGKGAPVAPRSRAAVGQVLGVSGERVRQVEARALARLRTMPQAGRAWEALRD